MRSPQAIHFFRHSGVTAMAGGNAESAGAVFSGSWNPGFCVRFADVLTSMVPLAARRRVPFLCSCKEKEPKESTPRSRRHLPALLAEGGLARRHILVPLARSRSRREPALRAGLIRLRRRCSAAATGPNVKNIKGNAPFMACAVRTLPVLGFDFPVPSELAEHRSLSRGCARALSEPESSFDSGELRSARLKRGAQGTARRMRGERPGVLSFGYFSLHKQRKVTCPRRESRPKAFGIAAGDSTTYFGAQGAPYTRWSAASGTIAFKPSAPPTNKTTET